MPRESDKSTPRLIVTVHGIRTFGHWQERLEEIIRLSANSDIPIIVKHYKFGYFSSAAFLIPPLRKWVTKKFTEALLAELGKRQWSRVDLVGHSFGTAIIAFSLLDLTPEFSP